MTRLLVALLFLLAAVLPAGAQQYRQATAHITTQTTTTVHAAVTGKRLAVVAGSVCVDANGTATGIALQDSAGTNLFGTGIVWVVGAGACLNFPLRGTGAPVPYGRPTALSTSLQVVTTVGNGPVEVYLEVQAQ